MKQALPIGVSSFAQVRKEGYYYLDKSMLIHDLLTDKTMAILFTRPRRFGKTLNMQMIKEFFDITNNTKDLFQDLEIAKSPYMREINQWPTLFFSFRESKGKKAFLLGDMKRNIFSEYKKYYFIRETLDIFTKEELDEVMEALREQSEDNLPLCVNAIRFLSKIVSEYYQKAVILLIDEYDTPMESAYVEGDYEELKDFFQMLYASALKDNSYLKMGIMTGIQRIAKENIFSGLNNLRVNTVKDIAYHQYFGLSTEEARKTLAYYDLELNEQVKQMYDGYNFGGLEIYNPWSLVNYAQERVLKPFWVNTASSSMIREQIIESTGEFKTEFEALIENQVTEVVLHAETSFLELQNSSTLWGLLLNAGYITLDEIDEGVGTEVQQIRIPNLEVQSEFKKIVSSYIALEDNSLVRMFHALIVKQDIDAFIKQYKHIVITMTSYYDGKEQAYHMLFLGMCVYLDQYFEISSNRETGTGRSDILLKSKSSKYKHMIIEFKQGDDVDKLAKEAVNQIKEKQYYAGLDGVVMMLGVAHNKKDCAIVLEE